MKIDNETLKQYCSAVNLSLQSENLQSAVDTCLQKYFVDKFGKEVVNTIIGYAPTTLSIEPTSEPLAIQIYDAFMRSLVNYAVADSIMLLMVHIANDGVTIKKNQDETTLYRYQQQQLENKLIDDAQFWYGRLCELIVENNATLFNDAELAQVVHVLAAHDLRTCFSEMAGVDEAAFFVFNHALIRRVWQEYAVSRGFTFADLYELRSKQQTDVYLLVMEAVVFEVLRRSIRLTPTQFLPRLIRGEMINEQRTAAAAAAHEKEVRENLQKQYNDQANAALQHLDRLLVARRTVSYQSRKNSNTDKFVVS